MDLRREKRSTKVSSYKTPAPTPFRLMKGNRSDRMHNTGGIKEDYRATDTNASAKVSRIQTPEVNDNNKADYAGVMEQEIRNILLKRNKR